MIRRTLAILLLILISANAFADTVGSVLLPNLTVPNACTIDYLGTYTDTSYMVPIYEPNTYAITYNLDGGNNNSANPTSYTIESATLTLSDPTKDGYTFNGWVDANNNPITSIPTGSTGNITLTAQWTKIIVHCDAGYYLPANSTECQICRENHYCDGGEYMISAEYDAGIELCPDGVISPEGTSGVSGCGKILHVGNNIIYLTTAQETTPALAVRLEDKVYYARTTPVSEGAKPMNKNTTESLRLRVDGIEYSIHDNTIKGEQ